MSAMDGTLYEYDAAGLQWRERGRGELRINFNKGQDSTRLIMRQVLGGCWRAGTHLFTPCAEMLLDVIPFWG